MESITKIVTGSIGPITPVQRNILRNLQLRDYVESIKRKIDHVYNTKLMDIYRQMLPLSKAVEKDQMDRFLLRIRQSGAGYQEKRYISLTGKHVGTEGDIQLTLSLKSVWMHMLSQREIPDAAFELSITIPENEKESHRKIIREFKPLLNDTADFIQECWGGLLESGIDNLDQYYEIGKIKFTSFNIEL